MTSAQPTSSSLGSPSSVPVNSAAKSSKKAGIIAGSVVGGVVLICLLLCVVVPFLLRRRRRRIEGKANGGTRRHGQPSWSDGTSPLLMQSDMGQRSTNTQDGHGRRPSDATPLMQFNHDLGHDAEADAYTTTTQNISPPVPLKASRQRELSTDSGTSRESFSQGSPSARIHRDVGNSSEPSPPRLPPIPQAEPLSNISEQPPSALRPSFRGLSRSRPNAPMEPLMEREGSGCSLSIDAHDQGYNKDRWSTAADPGGSHPRRLPESHLQSHLQPYSSRPASPSSPGGFGMGLTLLTSAFRKSLSVSSTITESSNSRNPLHHYPSVASIGATSATTGTYYSAQSGSGVDEDGRRLSGTLGTVDRMGVVDSSNPRTYEPRSQSPSSRSAHPSIPNASGSHPPSPLPPPPPLAMRALPQYQSPDTSNPHPPQPSTEPRGRAHIRAALAHRVRADPHPQPVLSRAGLSTHGVIDLVER